LPWSRRQPQRAPTEADGTHDRQHEQRKTGQRRPGRNRDDPDGRVLTSGGNGPAYDRYRPATDQGRPRGRGRAEAVGIEVPSGQDWAAGRERGLDALEYAAQDGVLSRTSARRRAAGQGVLGPA